MPAVMPWWQIGMRLALVLVSSSQHAAGARFWSGHPRRYGLEVLQNVRSFCPFGEIVARGTKRMCAIQSGVAGTSDRIVRNVLQFYWPLIEEIDGITKGSDLYNRETSSLYEDRTVENLVVHLILRLFSASMCVCKPKI